MIVPKNTTTSTETKKKRRRRMRMQCAPSCSFSYEVPSGVTDGEYLQCVMYVYVYLLC